MFSENVPATDAKHLLKVFRQHYENIPGRIARADANERHSQLKYNGRLTDYRV
jgi:hypothetical protein